MLKELPPENYIVEHYCRLRGISYPISNWSFYIALNLFKVAAIAQVVFLTCMTFYRIDCLVKCYM